MVKVFVPVSGGLLGDQTYSIQKAVRSMGEEVRVWSPSGKNDYDSDFAAAVGIYPTDHIALIGHSFGADAMIYTAEKLVKLGIPMDQLHLVDSVWAEKHPPKFNKDGTPIETFAYRRSQVWGLIPVADVAGVEIETIPDTNHNSICHSPVLHGKIVTRIGKLLVTT